LVSTAKLGANLPLPLNEKHAMQESCALFHKERKDVSKKKERKIQRRKPKWTPPQTHPTPSRLANMTTKAPQNKQGNDQKTN